MFGITKSIYEAFADFIAGLGLPYMAAIMISGFIIFITLFMIFYTVSMKFGKDNKEKQYLFSTFPIALIFSLLFPWWLGVIVLIGSAILIFRFLYKKHNKKALQ